MRVGIRAGFPKIARRAAPNSRCGPRSSTKAIPPAIAAAFAGL
jgi:hypothetical protein